MSKKSFVTKMMSRTLLIIVVSFLCISASFAQDSVAEKMASAKTMFSPSFSSLDDVQRSKVVTFFDNCSKPEKEAILSYMVQAITDSLKNENKSFVINYIGYYRLIAEPNDEYLPSLVLTEARIHYDNMNDKGINELISFMKDTNEKSILGLDTEIDSLENMKNDIEQSYDDMQGCWLMYNTNEKFLFPQEIIRISRKEKNKFCVSFVDPQLENLKSESGNAGSFVMKMVEKLMGDIPSKGVSDTCYFTKPKELFYFYSSEKLRKGKESASSVLRTTVRGAGNSVIGQLARSENFSTQLFGWFGVIGAEGIFNSLIDELAISKKSWCLREGYATMKSKSQMEIRYTYFIYKMNSKDATLSVPKITEVKSTLYRYPEKCDVVFIDEMRNLISDHPFDAEEQKKYYKDHPDVKKASKSHKSRKLHNEAQWERLKEYGKSH